MVKSRLTQYEVRNTSKPREITITLFAQSKKRAVENALKSYPDKMKPNDLLEVRKATTTDLYKITKEKNELIAEPIVTSKTRKKLFKTKSK